MTVLLAIQAADGMVLIADGRTTKVDARPGEPATDKVAVVSDRTRKLVEVPNAPVAVMLSGRSTLAKVPAAEVTTQILNDALDSLPTNELTVERIAKALHLGFIALVDQTDDPEIKTKPDDIEALVVGYDPVVGNPRSPKVLRVWAGQTDGVEPWLDGDPQGVWRDGDYAAREDVAQEILWWSQEEIAEKLELSDLPFDQPDILQRVIGDIHRYDGQSCAQILVHLKRELPITISTHPYDFEVAGGQWQYIFISPRTAALPPADLELAPT
ncbi:hypothetical protein [Kribbella sindirgiensis]|uniref:Uncharacterized protein n=1 Tax=Kribbella sindirgiensis TaxID=1124744 RepID=A0A4R0I1T1_9ACTN|nr:hypothetical protein [Kribbella sindirgiensis]TCC21667.1 hypothetical protein E0H50_35935 [Kribbella sindirgiensis]